MKGNDVIGVFRSEVALEDAMKRLEAEQTPAPVEKPKEAKKVKKEKKVEKNVRKTNMDA